MFLKAQLYQTERQLLLLQDGMARRTGAIWEAENILKVSSVVYVGIFLLATFLVSFRIVILI